MKRSDRELRSFRLDSTLAEQEHALMRAGIDPDASTWSEATLRRAEEILDAMENEKRNSVRRKG